MVAKNAHTAFYSIFPAGTVRLPKRYPRSNRFSDNSKSEMIEIVERSGKQAQVSTQIVSAIVLAATVIMSNAAMAVIGLQVAELVATPIQLSVGDLMRVVAGR